MAKKIYEEESYALQDGTAVTVRPLPLKPLRAFMSRWSDMEKLGTEAKETDVLDIMFDCAVIVLTAFNEVTEEQLEETLDMKTMQKVLSLGGGIMLDEVDDPKVRA